MAKPFDAASKHLIENRPWDWLRLSGFPVPDSNLDVSVVDADLSNVMTTAADKLIRVDHPPGGMGPYLAHIEFQSSADPGLDARVLLYNVLSRRRHGLPVWSAVFLLRPEAQSSLMTGTITDRLDIVSRLEFGYHLIKVWELQTQTVLRAGPGVLPLAPITAVQPDQLSPVISAVRQRLSREVRPQEAKEFLLAMRVLMGLRYQEQLTESLMQSIEEMVDSVEWQKIYRSGKAEGKAEGVIEGELLLLLRQGTARFGSPSVEILNRLKAIDSSEKLAEMAVLLLGASNWDELFQG